MFVWSFRMTRRELIIAVSGIIIFVIAAVLLLMPQEKSQVSADGYSLAADTEAARQSFLGQYGWQTDGAHIAVREVVIPTTGGEDFAEYCRLLNMQGFDAEALKGERVKLWTYRVSNYPVRSESVVANILVKDGIVVGGDISGASADSFMHGFDPKLFGEATAQAQRDAVTIDRTVPDSIPADTDALPEPDDDDF